MLFSFPVIISLIALKFQFGGLIPLLLHQWGEVWRGGGNLWSQDPILHAKFHPGPSVQRVAPVGQKTSKLASE